MMKRIGNSFLCVLLLWLAFLIPAASASVTAKVDRNRVTLGDSLRLTITTTDNEDIDDGDLAPLLGDFEIMSRSTSSNTSIINGRMSQSRQMILDIAPLREGDLVIPPLQIGGSTTAPMTVEVSAASDSPADGQQVRFEAEVDKHSAYVQGQVILTLRAQQSVSLDDRSITQLELDNAFVKPLEQNSFQRTINGQPWLVHELRYAIFPEQSGTLEIPAQTFAGRLNQGRRSFFGHGSGGQLVRRSTAPIKIEVLPKPDGFGTTDWLPARALTLEESWSTPPEQLRVGESATRTIRIVGEGLQGAQLPPVLFSPIDGLKYYPDQPQITEQETASGLKGIRQDSAAVVPTREGAYVIPEIRIPWWDTQLGKTQVAVLPERRITVGPGEPAATQTPSAVPSGIVDTAPDMPVKVGGQSGNDLRLWQALTGLSTLGWCITLWYFRRRQRPSAPANPDRTETGNERKTLKQLLIACTENDAKRARTAAIQWAGALYPLQGVTSLEHAARVFGDADLDRELKSLDESLFSPGKHAWNGDGLADCARRLQTTRRAHGTPETEELGLYPR
jgi:BatD DUF11 like domain